MSTHEIAVNTAPVYVIGYLCRELVAMKLVALNATARTGAA